LFHNLKQSRLALGGDKRVAEGQFWDSIYRNINSRQVQYDLWLEPFLAELAQSKDTPVIDLGCGAGNDTLYLTERGFSVIACDLSPEALKRVKEIAPAADTRLVDLLDPLPFASGSAHAVIADLSLHYFGWVDTERIASEIRRVLNPSGMLLCRVNSTKDVEYGAGRGTLLEPNYYEWDGKRKRFFDRPALELLFRDWDIMLVNEQTMNRYDKPKVVWTLAARNK